MKRYSELSGKLNNVMFFLAGVLTVVIIGILVIGIQTMAQNNSNKNKDYKSSNDNQQNVSPITRDTQKEENGAENGTEEANSVLGDEKWAEGVVTYNGHSYKYNTKLKIYLLMGIDNDGPVEVAKDYVSGGQSDAIFLLVADEEKETLKIVSINRNTMTDISVCDKDGKSMGKMQAQICVQHGFGDGKKLSCTRTVDAVSDMFYNLPINGYIAFNMGAIRIINDVMGGVSVDVLDDISSSDGKINLKKGEKVTLTDDEAYLYLRGRNLDEYGSANDRLRRQEQYINNYILAVKNSRGISNSSIEDLYNQTEEYMVTSVEFTELVSQLIDFEYTEDDMYTVPGETKMGKEYEEFYINKDDFYDLIFKVFYNEVE